MLLTLWESGSATLFFGGKPYALLQHSTEMAKCCKCVTSQKIRVLQSLTRNGIKASAIRFRRLSLGCSSLDENNVAIINHVVLALG